MTSGLWQEQDSADDGRHRLGAGEPSCDALLYPSRRVAQDRDAGPVVIGDIYPVLSRIARKRKRLETNHDCRVHLVGRAVEEGRVHPERYESYLRMRFGE